MSDSDRSEDLREVEIRILKSEKYPEGGMAYITGPTSEEWECRECYIEIERVDERKGSLELESYLMIKLLECEQNRIIDSYAGGIPCLCSRAFIHHVFGTKFTCYDERQEETIEHPSFGTILIKGLTFEEYDPNVDY